MKTKSFKIRSDYFGKFINKFEKFCKKAVKLGYPTPSYKITKETFERQPGEPVPLSPCKPWKEIEVYYELPIIEGWKVVGNRERIGESIFTNIMTEDDCTSYHKSKTIGCEHCGTKHYRKKSILLKNEISNNIIEVGSSCSVDFFGHSVNNLNWFCDPNLSEEDWSQGSGSGYSSFNLEKTLIITAAYMNEFGYKSPKSKGYSTKERVIDCHTQPKWRRKDFTDPKITDKAEKLAQDTIAYFKGLNPDEYYNNTYMTNLIKIVENEYFDGRLLGYSVSMVSAYQRALGYEKESKETHKKQLKSKFQGEIKQRLKGLEVTLKTHKSFDNQYGVSHLLIFNDEKGNIYSTFYSGASILPEENDKIILTGTVKNHQDYKGIKQTVLARIKINFFCPDQKEILITKEYCYSKKCDNPCVYCKY